MPVKPTDVYDHEFLADRAYRVIAAAVYRDDEAVAAGIEDISTAYGHDGVFALCYALCGTIHKAAFPHMKRGDGTLAGDMMVVEANREPDCPNSAATLWAAQFLAAYINGDGGTTASLFYGCLDDRERAVGSVLTLISMTGDIVRQRNEELRAEGSGSAETTG